MKRCSILGVDALYPAASLRFLSHFSLSLQSMAAASFHGSAHIRCVSSPSGGLSSRRAYLSLPALFRISWHTRHLLVFYQLWVLINSFRRLTVGSCLRGVRKNQRQGHLRWNPPLLFGARHRPPPIRFTPYLLWMWKWATRFCLTRFYKVV